MLGQRWSVDLFVFRGSLVGVTAAISMVEGAACCVVAKVAAWQAWCAFSSATLVVAAECGGIYLSEVHFLLLFDDDGPAGKLVVVLWVVALITVGGSRGGVLIVPCLIVYAGASNDDTHGCHSAPWRRCSGASELSLEALWVKT
jgi:hypothetical protein